MDQRPQPRVELDDEIARCGRTAQMLNYLRLVVLDSADDAKHPSDAVDAIEALQHGAELAVNHRENLEDVRATFDNLGDDLAPTW